MESHTKPRNIWEQCPWAAQISQVPRITASEQLLSRIDVRLQAPKTAHGTALLQILTICPEITQDPALTDLKMAKSLSLKIKQTAWRLVSLSLTMAWMVMAEKWEWAAIPLPQLTISPITNRVSQSLSDKSPAQTITTTKCLDLALTSQTLTTPYAHTKLCRALPITEGLQSQIKSARGNTKIVWTKHGTRAIKDMKPLAISPQKRSWQNVKKA